MTPSRKALSYGAALAVLALAWKILAMLLTVPVLPQPERAVTAFVHALGTAGFWMHFLTSSYRAVAAMALAWGLGFSLGVCMGGARRLDALLSPLIFLTYPVPKIVLLPVVLVLFGMGDAAKIVMISLIIGYQVLVTTRDGVKAIPEAYLDSVRSLGADNRQLVREVLVPAGLPHGFTALRLNSGVSVAVLFFVESFATRRGLGYLIMDAWGRLNYEAMFVGILGMSLLGVILYETTNLLERRFCRWQFCGA